MSDPTPPSTAVTRTDPLSPARREEAHLRKIEAEVTGAIAKLSWGKDMEEYTRRALAHWGAEHGVDVILEVDMLGGKPYLNSKFYLRKLGEMVAERLVEYAEADFCHRDDRLDKVTANEEDRERTVERRRREDLRIRYGIPDEAKGACVFRVKLKSLDRELVGANWCGGGTRKSDPVGDAEPIKTAESRAARRCLRLVVSHLPVARAIEATVEALDEIGTQARDDEARNALPSAASHRGVGEGGYGESRRSIGSGKPPVEVVDMSQRKSTGRDLGPDPYLEPKAPEPVTEQDDLALDRELLERERGE